MEHKAHFIVKGSMAICLLLCSGFYNKELCFYPQDFPQPLLILSRLSATSSSSVVLFLPFLLTQASCAWERLFCFSTLSTTGFWNTAEPCLFSAPHTEASALPREGGHVWLCESAHGGHEKGWVGKAWVCVILFGADFSSCMELIIMIVALSHNIVRVALLFPNSEEKPQESIILSWDDGSGHFEMASIWDTEPW